MSIYPRPIEIHVLVMVHDGGTKDYHCYRITPEGGDRSLVVFEWGKIGGHRSRKVMLESTPYAATAAIVDQQGAKEKRGYRAVERKKHVVRERSEFWRATSDGLLSACEANSLFSNEDGVLSNLGWTLDGLGSVVSGRLSRAAAADEAKARLLEKRAAHETEEKAKLAQQAESDDFYKSNPDWGLF